MTRIAKQFEDNIRKEAEEDSYKELQPIRDAIKALDHRSPSIKHEINGKMISFDDICGVFLNQMRALLTLRHITRKNERVLKNLMCMTKPGMSSKELEQKINEIKTNCSHDEDAIFNAVKKIMNTRDLSS